MSIDIKFDNDVGVIFTLRNEFSYDEVKKAFEELFSNKKFEAIRYWIIDRRNSVNYKMTTDQVIELSNLCLTTSQHKKNLTQILVSGSDLQYGTSRQYQVYMERTGWDIIAFRHIQSAERWVNEHLSP